MARFRAGANDPNGNRPNDDLIRSKNRFHFNLRSFRLNDTSFAIRNDHRRHHHHHHHQQQQQEDESSHNTSNIIVPRQHSTAAEIFGGSHNDNSPNDQQQDNIKDLHSQFEAYPTKTGVVDGKETSFELRSDLHTQRPLESREKRLKVNYDYQNLQRTHWEVRWRQWMIQKSLLYCTLMYLLLLLGLNLVVAGLFYAHPDSCCGNDGALSYMEVLDFTIQTSTTIGYGGYVPQGLYANALVFLLSYIMLVLNTVLAGLLFLKFTTPTANIQFSDVITYSNVNGLPCLQIRVANGDGNDNLLTDVSARLTHLYVIKYHNEQSDDGTSREEQQFGQTMELKLLSDKRDHLADVWTLKHVIDESSPLFGLHFDEYPGSSILNFRLTVHAIQDATKSSISAHTGYEPQDVMIGQSFQDQISWTGSKQQDTSVVTIDYAKLSQTQSAPVWYPKQSRY